MGLGTILHDGTGTAALASTARDELLGHIYDGATDPSRWPVAMEMLADILGGHSAWLSRLDLSDGSGSGMVVRMDPEAQARYFAYYNGLDPLCNVDDQGGPQAPAVMTDESRLPKAELLGTEFYNDFMRPIGAHSVLMLRLAARGTTVYGLNVNRAEGRGRFEAADIALATSLQGHLTRGLHLAQRFEALRLSEWHGAGASASQGLFLLDSLGRLVIANPAAERYLQEECGLLLAGNRLTAADPDAANRLEALVAAATCSEAGQRRGGSVAIPSRTKRLPLLLAVAPFRSSVLPVFGAERCALLAVTDPNVGVHAQEGQFTRLFGLTAAEARVAKAVLDGQSLREVAASQEVSIHTVRTHLARTFDKTGVRRQAELVRLLGSLPRPWSAAG